MRLIKKNLLSATLFSIVVFILILVAISSSKNENSTIPKKAKLELVQESEWLSPLSSSIPVNERDAILYKLIAGDWLSTKKLPSGEYEIYSQNGKRKALARYSGRDYVELSFLDSTGVVVWKKAVGGKVTISNNGYNFITDCLECLLSFYNIKMGHSPLFTTGEGYDAYKFSEDGQCFVAVGRNLDFYTADGKLLWRKNTGNIAPKLLALNNDLQRIAVVSNTAISHDNPPEFKDEDTSSRLNSKKEFQTNREQSRKSYLTFLDRNGKVISQMELDYQVIEGIVFLPNEPNLILIDARINLLLIDGQAKSILWKYPNESNPLYQTTNIDFSKDGKLIAMGVISDANRKESPRYAILLNKEGEQLQKIEIKDTYKSQLGGPMAFFGEKECLLVRSQNNMWVYKVSYTD